MHTCDTKCIQFKSCASQVMHWSQIWCVWHHFACQRCTLVIINIVQEWLSQLLPSDWVSGANLRICLFPLLLSLCPDSSPDEHEVQSEVGQWPTFWWTVCQKCVIECCVVVLSVSEYLYIHVKRIFICLLSFTSQCLTMVSVMVADVDKPVMRDGSHKHDNRWSE